jgi:hypothetical protein
LPASPVPIARAPYHDAASGKPSKPALEFCNMLVNGRLEFRCSRDTFKFDLGWRLHDRLQIRF